MLRVILLRKTRDCVNGMETENYFTIDIEAPEVENRLKSGGSGESGYDVTRVIGIEIL